MAYLAVPCRDYSRVALTADHEFTPRTETFMPESESNIAETQDTAKQVAAPSVDDASRPFVGKWHTLVSTTNWEKGRIIGEWRSAKEKAGEEVSEFSDEAWAQLVGEVTSQHVGRLRRVFERFGETFKEYDGLFWSHFHAALDWDDSEIWLEGALQQGWSISKMRRQRDEAHGKHDDADVVASRMAGSDVAGDAELAEVVDPEAGADTLPGDNGDMDDETKAKKTGEDSADGVAGEMQAAERSTAKSRPFDGLAELPDDLADAFEAMKLSILSHKLTNWEDVSCDDVLASLEALKKLAVAPSE